MKIEKKCYINGFGIDNLFHKNKIKGRIYNLEISSTDEFEKKELETLSRNINKKIKITFTTEEPILDEVEKEYLSSVIKPFRNRVAYIAKIRETKTREYIKMYIRGSYYFLIFPFFKKDMMYKGMKPDKKYTLEELGL